MAATYGAVARRQPWQRQGAERWEPAERLGAAVTVQPTAVGGQRRPRTAAPDRCCVTVAAVVRPAGCSEGLAVMDDKVPPAVWDLPVSSGSGSEADVLRLERPRC